ncbi:FKBP-type peptidyl-prolyl cis-trans isomerase [Sunxiuqinia sp. sy24]|uniref:FKBP-type peptidyl-prolyl cis-trans isomerase n=1 Tax=Sunxiuqinia sp. sy24 TaxID=3461495 RepID=UPI0040462199
MSEQKFKGELEEFSYALGLSISSNLIQSGVKTIEPSSFMLALEDIFTGKEPQLTPDQANKILQEFMEKQQNGQGKENLEQGLQFLAENREKEGVNETASGLQYMVLEEGDGEKPSPADEVKCHYHGTLIDGTVFDSSVQRGEPATFPVNGVIQGWVEALQMMTTGSKWRLFVPSDLAYGDRGAGGAIGPHSTLIFEVELLEIV